MSSSVRGDMDLSWIDDFLPSIDGITIKEKREAGKAPGAPRRVNEGSAKKLVKTPSEAEDEADDAINEDGDTDDEYGKTQGKGHAKKPPKDSIVKIRM